MRPSAFILLYLLVVQNTAEAQTGSSTDTVVSAWSKVTPTVVPASAEQQLAFEAALQTLPAFDDFVAAATPPLISCTQMPSIAATDAEGWRTLLSDTRKANKKDCAQQFLHHWQLLLQQQPNANAQRALQIETTRLQIWQGKALEAEETLRPLLDNANQYPNEKASIYFAAAHLHKALQPDNLQASFDYAAKAAEAAAQTENIALQIDCNRFMGSLQRDMFFGASLRAVPYHEKAITLAQQINDTTRWIGNLIPLLLNYDDAKRFDKSFELLTITVHLLREKPDMGALQRVYIAASRQYAHDEQHDKALDILLKALRLSQSIGDTSGIVNCHYQVLSEYMAMKNYDAAETTLKSINALGYTKTGEAFYALEKARGNHAKALEYLEAAYADVAAEYQNRSTSQLNEWETKLRTKEKQELLDTANRQRWWLILLSSIAFILMLWAVYAFWKQRRQRIALAKQKNLIEQQAEELRGLDKIKNQFFANISHELRTPLTLILAPTESQLLLAGKESQWSEEKTRPLLQNVFSNGQHLLRLIEEILDLSKLDAQKLEVHLQPVVFKVFLQSISEAFYMQAQQKGVSFQVDSIGISDVLVLELDRNKVEKILYNLLSNAFKFTPAGGSIYLSVQLTDKQLLCSVRDTGRGIHPDDMPHLFERFFQSTQQDRRISGGTGIGLAFVKALTELMGGQVSVTSEWGKGACFSLTLPLQKASVSLPEILEENTEADNQTDTEVPLVGDFTIAIAEDHEDLRQFLVELLSTQFQTIAFENGKLLHDYLFQTNSPKVDLIVSDLMMPEMDGFELLAQIKQSPHWCLVPSIILTARAGERDKLQALTIGVDDYLTKPFSSTELIVRVRNLLRNFQQRISALRKEKEEQYAIETIPSQETDIAAPEKLSLSPEEQQWIKQIELSLMERLSDTELTLEVFAGIHFISERQFQRRIQKITGLSYNDYVKEMRLQKARMLLEDENQNLSLKEISAKVGFKTTSYFNKLFEARFGKSPVAFVSQ